MVGRIIQNKDKQYLHSFTARDKRKKLIYFEIFDDIELAIVKENYIKGKSGGFKLNLITSVNPEFNDLWYQIKIW